MHRAVGSEAVLDDIQMKLGDVPRQKLLSNLNELRQIASDLIGCIELSSDD